MGKYKLLFFATFSESSVAKKSVKVPTISSLAFDKRIKGLFDLYKEEIRKKAYKVGFSWGIWVD